MWILTTGRNVCAKLAIDGACPTQPGEVALAPDIAALLQAKVGDQLNYVSPALRRPLPLRVVGIYQPADLTDPYWGPSTTSNNGTVDAQRVRSGTIFTPLSTFSADRPERLNVTIDLMATEAAVRSGNPEVMAQSTERAVALLGAQGLDLSTGFRAYADRALGEENLVFVGVAAATLQLLILAWFALALAVRLTGESRRPDVALLKLRGSGRFALWSLAAGQAAVPIVAGGVVGLGVGWWIGRWWAGPIANPGLASANVAATIGAAATAVLIAVGSAVLAERRMLAEPVGDLARGVPTRRRGWRAGILDAVVIALAVAAAVELRSGVVAATQFRGLDVLAPSLVALAVGVVAAWLVPRVAAAIARPALRSTRLGLGLGAVHLARRTALPRVLAMLTLAVATVTGAVNTWDIANRAEHDRATVEVGADRVLTVQTATPQTLLTAVDQADPSGRYAMAAVRTLGGAPVLAVDSSRLAAVVPWTPAYGLPQWSTVASSLRAGLAAPTTVHNGSLALDATWTPGPGSRTLAAVAVVLAGPDGTFSPVILTRTGAATTYQGAVTGCDPGCRLVGFQVLGPAGISGGTLVLRQLSAGGDVVVPPAAFADRTRWRTSILSGDELPTLATAANGLSVTVDHLDHPSQSTVVPVFAADVLTPVPMYVAGPLTAVTLIGQGTAQAPGGGPVPATVAGTAALLPRAGTVGELVDLSAMNRLRPGRGRYEVWLAAGTPDSVVQALTAAGLSIVDQDSVGSRLTQLRAQGPPLAQEFLLAIAVVGLALALAAFVIAIGVERSGRAAELGWLRRQGLRSEVVRRVSYGSYLGFVVVAALLGVGTSLLATRLVSPVPRVFGDGWSVIAPPGTTVAVILAVTLALLVVVVAVAALGSAALVRAVRRAAATVGGGRR